MHVTFAVALSKCEQGTIAVSDPPKHVILCIICQWHMYIGRAITTSEKFTPARDGTKWKFTECHPLTM